MSDSGNCPNCGEKIKVGAFSSNALLPSQVVEMINYSEGCGWTHACNKCGDQFHASARRKIRSEANAARMSIQRNLDVQPIMSIHSPVGWDYRPIGIVTAQTVTGTGILSEFTSAWTDVFGAQSNAFSNKLRAGEDMCKASLRLQCAKMGGNAILAVDIDYGEVGAAKGMLMVCMTGTVTCPPKDPSF